MRTSFRDLDALDQRPQVLAAIAATIDPDPLAGGPGKFLDHGGRDCLLACAFRHRLRIVGVGLGLIADRLQAGEALFQ